MKMLKKLSPATQKMNQKRVTRPDIKQNFLKENLKCPSCGRSNFKEGGSVFMCQDCSWTIESSRGYPLNFISDNQKERFNIVDTSNVSAHPYDGNALFLINQIHDNGGWILDCGAGLRTFTSDRLVQLEVVNYPNIDILAVNQILPFRDNTFDAILSLDVLEHVDDPFTSAAEIKRILKPGGILYVDIPFLQAEHGYPHHYFNATRQGLLKLFNDELEAEAHVVPNAGHPIAVLQQFLNIYVRELPTSSAERFLKMSISDILAKTHDEWMREEITKSLSDQGKWELASTTQAVFKKPLDENTTKNLNNFLIQQLPGFSHIPLPALSFFDSQKYLDLYPDLAEAAKTGQINPWVHFLTYGLSEGRSPSSEIPFEAFENDKIFSRAIEAKDFLKAAERIDKVSPFLASNPLSKPQEHLDDLQYPHDFSSHPSHPLLTRLEAKGVLKK